MKKTFIFLTTILLFLVSSKKIFAEIIQGNSSAESRVETNVQGNGQVYTRIEVDQNGVKKVVESDKPGKIEVKVENNSSSVKIDGVEQEPNSSKNSNEEKVSPSPSSSPSPTIMPKNSSKTREDLLTSFKDFLQKLLRSFFHF